jgi:DNA-binding transcriptional ArsR family regulator
MAGDDLGGAERAVAGAAAAGVGGAKRAGAGGARAGTGPAAAGAGGAERAADEALKALAEPRRRAILRLVASDELAAGEIAAAFEVTRTAVSQHLTVLRNAGLLTERRDGTRRLYRARPEGLAGLRAFLDDMWASSLEEARRLVEAELGITDDEEHVCDAG